MVRYRGCDLGWTPHKSHYNEDGTRCLGATQEAQDRADALERAQSEKEDR